MVDIEKHIKELEKAGVFNLNYDEIMAKSNIPGIFGINKLEDGRIEYSFLGGVPLEHFYFIYDKKKKELEIKKNIAVKIAENMEGIKGLEELEKRIKQSGIIAIKVVPPPGSNRSPYYPNVDLGKVLEIKYIF